MRNHPIALSVLALLVSTQSVNAQIPGPVCAEGLRAQDSLSYPTEELENRASVWANAARAKLHPERSALVQPVDQAVIDSFRTLFVEDSAGLAWALAGLVVDTRFANDLEAAVAGEVYRYFSGDATPILFYLKHSGTHPRVLASLDAIKRPVSPLNELIIMGFACEAAWLLKAAASDTMYQNGMVALPLLTDARLIIWRAFYLVDPEYKILIRRLVVSTEASSGGDLIHSVE